MTVLMRARNSGDTRWITWSANTADYEGIHAPEPILLNSAILEIIFGAAASKIDNDSTVEGTYVSDALEYLNTNGGGITGPEITTDNAVVRWDGTDGYFVKNSVAILNELGGFSLGSDGYIEIGNSVSTTGDVRLNLGGYIDGITNGGIDIIGADGLTGGAINILSGDSSEEEINAGTIAITGGKATGIPGSYGLPSTKGGCINITGGDSTNNAGGIISIIGGSSADSYVGIPPFPAITSDPLQQGGVINIQGGASTVGVGGNIYITGGATSDATKASGGVTVAGGITYETNGIAGGVSVSGGAAQGGSPGTGGTAGAISIAGGTGGWGAGGTVSIIAGGGWVSGGEIGISAGTATAGGGGVGGNISLSAGRSEGTNDGGSITIEAGRADETGAGGSITIKSGINNESSYETGGNGGNILIESGVSGGDGNTSGEINITSGNGDYVGAITLQSGNASDGYGGDINVLGGGSINSEMDPDKVGGVVTISGGYGNYAHGGNVVLNGGSGSSYYGGHIMLNGGSGSVSGGNIVLTTNGGVIDINSDFEFSDNYFSALNENVIRLYGSDSHYSGFKASATGTNNTWTLPEDDGPDGYVLTTDGSKNLYWSAGGGGGTTNVFNTGMVMLAGIATNSIESWQTIGAVHYVPEEYSGTTTALLRALINTGDTDGYAKLRVWNLTHDEIGGAEMTSNSTSFDPVSAVIPLNAEEAVYALQLCVDGECEATAANAWVQLGSSPVSVELTTMPESIYAGVETTFGITVSNVPWVLIIDGYARATGTGTGSEQNVSVTIPTGDGYRYAPVLLSVGAVEDTGTIKAQEILELGSLCVAMVPGLNPTQSYSGHGGDLYVWVGTYFVGAPGEVVTGITYGGNALTKVSAEGSSSGNDVWMHCYRLAAENMPAPGAQDIVVSCVSGAMTAISLAVAETSGTISTPDDVQHGSSACPNDTNVSVTTAVDNSVVIGAIICSDNATYTPLSGQTIIEEVDPGMYAGMAIGWYQAGIAGSTAANWTPVGYNGSAVITTAISVRPA